jgi:hypothetical protein
VAKETTVLEDKPHVIIGGVNSFLEVEGSLLDGREEGRGYARGECVKLGLVGVLLMGHLHDKLMITSQLLCNPC